jgi:hypothetical protein
VHLHEGGGVSMKIKNFRNLEEAINVLKENGDRAVRASLYSYQLNFKSHYILDLESYELNIFVRISNGNLVHLVYSIKELVKKWTVTSFIEDVEVEFLKKWNGEENYMNWSF